MASEPLVLKDDYGSTVRTGRTQEDKPFISITGELTSVMAVFSGERFDELRELLDRAATPGAVIDGG